MADTPGADDLAARLDALREAGAADRDPVRFAHLDALARRTAAQPAVIRQTLYARLNALADELAEHPANLPAPAAPDKTASPLAALLAHIGEHAHAHPAARQPARAQSPTGQETRQKTKKPLTGPTPQAPELKAVAIFRDAWSRLSTEQQLTQTLAQAPENAGPMNSQHLVLRSLELMRDIAPDYLQGFMSHVDTLIWLEHAAPIKAGTDRPASSESKPKRKARKST